MKIVALALFVASSAFARLVSPFELPIMNGEAGQVFKSADHPNAVFVVENYFYNCPYCHQNAPNVHKLADEFANNERVQVLDVGIDSSNGLYQQWIDDTNPKHPVLKDYPKKLTAQLGTSGYPSTYVLDCNLNVKLKTSGVWSSATAAKIRTAVNQALTTTCIAE